jgi:hypothetical protein
MDLLAFPNEILDIIIDFLNVPENPLYDIQHAASTICLCKTAKGKDYSATRYPLWAGAKRDFLPIGGVCSRLRALAFDEVWLKRLEMNWSAESLKKAGSRLSSVARSKVRSV